MAIALENWTSSSRASISGLTIIGRSTGQTLGNSQKAVLRLPRARIGTTVVSNGPVLTFVGPTAHATVNSSALLDIIFIHGLTGDKFTTWSFDGTSSWLEWLAQDFNSINVYAAAYDSTIFASVLTGDGASLVDRATTLLDALVVHLTTELGSWFRNYVTKTDCPVRSYYETRKTKGVMVVDGSAAELSVHSADSGLQF